MVKRSFNPLHRHPSTKHPSLPGWSAHPPPDLYLRQHKYRVVGRDPQERRKQKFITGQTRSSQTDRRQVESSTRHTHTTCGTQVKKHLRPPSHPAMDQRLLLKSPLAKNNTSPQRCPAWLGTRVAIAEKLTPYLLSLSPLPLILPSGVH